MIRIFSAGFFFILFLFLSLFSLYTPYSILHTSNTVHAQSGDASDPAYGGEDPSGAYPGQNPYEEPDPGTGSSSSETECDSTCQDNLVEVPYSEPSDLTARGGTVLVDPDTGRPVGWVAPTDTSCTGGCTTSPPDPDDSNYDGSDSNYVDDSTYPDSGYITPWDVSGKVFLDTNADGVFNGSDTGIPSEPVYLQNAAGTSNYTGEYTDASGNYFFGGQQAGSDYRVTHSVPAGYVRTNDDSVTFSLGPDFSKNFGVRKSIVTVNNAVINTSPVTPNGSTQYTITVTATNETGGNDITDQYFLINYQNSDSSLQPGGKNRGLFRWSNNNFAGWPANSYDSLFNCSGGGQAGRYILGYGNSYTNLISCSSSVSGAIRTTTFNVTFDTSFKTPETGNIISAYAANTAGAGDGWKPFGTFNIVPPPPTVTPTPPFSACLDSGDPGSRITISWTNSGVNWVDIDTGVSPFVDGSYYHKAITVGETSTTANGFGPYPSGSGNLSFNPGTTYYVRTYNGTINSQVASFNYAVCSFDYSLASSNAYVSRGKTISNPIPATRIQGITQSVSYGVLSSTPALPTSITTVFNPASCSPTCTPGLEISASATAPFQTYVITVRGSTTEGLQKDTTFNLTVSSPAFIQTTGGDVHSNTRINVPGAP